MGQVIAFKTRANKCFSQRHDIQFSKTEYATLLACHATGIQSGAHRDYALDHGGGCVVFSFKSHTDETIPTISISKMRDGQGQTNFLYHCVGRPPVQNPDFYALIDVLHEDLQALAVENRIKIEKRARDIGKRIGRSAFRVVRG